MADFSQQFELIYKIYSERAVKDGTRPSKAALAKFLAVSNGKLQKWECGQVPLPDDLEMLHQTFGLAYAWLITGKGEPFDAQIQQGQAESGRVAELEKENYALKAELAQTRNTLAETQSELLEQSRHNRRLSARLFVEGASDQAGQTVIGKTGSQGC